MAKTVFGIPGVGKTTTEGGGGAVAPQGTPGALSSRGLPQKSGKDDSPNISKTPEQPPLTIPSVSLKPEVKVPKMATPMAKPISGSAAPKAVAQSGGKTVFGMPAMKLPITPETKEEQKTTPPEPKAFVAPLEEAPLPKSNAAYNATVLGMPAIEPTRDIDNQQPEPSDLSPGKVNLGTDNTIESEAIFTSPKLNIPTHTEAMPETRTPDNKKASSNQKLPFLILVAVLAFIVIALIVIAIFLFTHSNAKQPVSMATPLDRAAVCTSLEPSLNVLQPSKVSRA